MINEGAKIEGDVDKSVIFQGVRVGKGATVSSSVVLPSAIIEEGAVVKYAIIAQDAVIRAGARVEGKEGEIFVVPEGAVVNA